jgi:Co/Zn/Cd efflux system component
MVGGNGINGFRHIIRLVVLLNLGYFGIEFAVARSIGSVSLLADSVDFLEDASVNILILLALSWSVVARARVGMVLAGVLLVPAVAFVWVLWSKLSNPVPPDALPLALTGIGALAVNLTCAFLLAKYRHAGGSLAKAAFLSARNDALATIGIIAAGVVTAFWWTSVWPDVIVGLGIAAMNVDAAHEVWTAARKESAAAA